MKRAALAILAAVLVAPLPAFADARPLGALESLAQQTTAALGAVPATSLVVCGGVSSDQGLPRGDDLCVRVAQLVAGRVGQAARFHAHVASLEAARPLTGKSGGLLFLKLELSKGELRAVADVYPTIANPWDRIRNPVPAPIRHGFAAVRVDAEVRAFLPPIVLEQAGVHKVPHGEGEVLAAACGDLDGDGGNEIALVSRTRVALGRVRGGRFVVERSAPWSSIARRAPSPMRDALGTAALAPWLDRGILAPALFVGTTDRGGVVLGPDLSPRQALEGLPLDAFGAAMCAAPNAAAWALEGPLFDCGGQHLPPPTLPVPRFDAFAATPLFGKDGSLALAIAAREPGGKLRVRVGEDTRTLEGAGAQVALGDLDQDGICEVATTQDAPPDRRTDEILVSSLVGSEWKARLRLPTPAPVRALAVCPPEEKGLPALIAVVGGEVWIIR